MVKRSILTLVVGTCLILPLQALAFTPGLAYPDGAPFFTMEGAAGVGLMTGDTTYQIGGAFKGSVRGVRESGDIGFFPLSELKFPLDVSTMTIGAAAGIGPVLARLSFSTNITDDAGTMEDSDWGVYYLNGMPGSRSNSLDIFSESDATLDATWFRIDALYRFMNRERFTVAVGPSFRTQKLEYEVRDLDQSYPSSRDYFGSDSDHDLVSGLVGTYEVTYQIPAVMAAAEFRPIPGLSIGAELGVGYVKAEDRDDHLLRAKLNEGECTGAAVMVGAGVRYTAPFGLFAGLSLDFLSISAEGEQRQTYYETTGEANKGDWFEIDQEISSQQFSLDLTVGYRF